MADAAQLLSDAAQLLSVFSHNVMHTVGLRTASFCQTAAATSFPRTHWNAPTSTQLQLFVGRVRKAVLHIRQLLKQKPQNVVRKNCPADTHTARVCKCAVTVVLTHTRSWHAVGSRSAPAHCEDRRRQARSSVVKQDRS